MRKRLDVTLDEAVLERLRAQGGNRSRFVEAAILAKLDGEGDVAQGPEQPVVDRQVAGSKPAVPAEASLDSRAVEPVPDGGRADRAGGREAITRSSAPASPPLPPSGRVCSRCGMAIPSPALKWHPMCGGRVLPDPV